MTQSIHLRREQVEMWDQMVKDCGLTNRIDVLNSATTLLKWAHDEIQKGRKIASVGEDGDVMTVSIPSLEP